MRPSLRKIAASGLVWTSAEAVWRMGVKLVAMVILTRLLTPEDFGLVALLMPIITVMGAVVGFGLSVAIVQRKDLTDHEASSAYWLQLGSAVVASVGLAAAAPLIARFFGHDVLVPMLWALLAGLVIRTSSAVIAEKLLRNMQLAAISKIFMAAALSSSLASVLAAFAGLGPWAIVIGTVTNHTVITAGRFLVSRWRPSLTFLLADVARLLTFGLRMLAANVLASLNEGIYAFAIGRAFGVGELGFFNRARTFPSVSMSVLQVVTIRTTLPVFSSIQGEPERILRGLREVVRVTMLATAPAMLGFAVLSEPIFVVVFGEAWRPAAALAPAFCLYALVNAPMSALSQVILSLGQAHLMLRLTILLVGATAAGVALAVPFGLFAVAWAAPAAAAVHMAATLAVVRHLLGYAWVAVLRDVGPPLGCAVAMSAIVAVLSAVVPWPSHVVRLVALVPAGVALYAVLVVVFVRDTLRLLKPLLMRRGGTRVAS